VTIRRKPDRKNPSAQWTATVALALSEGGRTPSHADIARHAGVSVSTVKRLLQKARQAGLITWETGRSGGLDTALGYRRPKDKSPAQPASSKPGSAGGQNGEMTQRDDLRLCGKTPGKSAEFGLNGDGEVSADWCEGKVSSERVCSAHPTSVCSSHRTDTSSSHQSADTTSSTPGHRGQIFDPRIRELVEFFEVWVTPHFRRRITERNRRGWRRTATRWLIDEHESLAELRQIVAWLFSTAGGELPSWLEPPHGKSRVTSLAQIAEHHDELRKAMRGAATKRPDGIDATSSFAAKAQVRPYVTDPVTEDRVGQLVEHLLALRKATSPFFRNQPDDSPGVGIWRRRVAEMFRQMLYVDARSFDDVSEVLSLAEALDDHIDLRRYHHPSALRVEFDELAERVRGLTAALERAAANQPVAPPPPPPEPTFAWRPWAQPSPHPEPVRTAPTRAARRWADIPWEQRRTRHRQHHRPPAHQPVDDPAEFLAELSAVFAAARP
jgi:hypothetical protein